MEDAQKIETDLAPSRAGKLTLRQKLQLIHGKVYRFYVGHFRKSLVRRSLAQRKGECARCGTCCQLLFRCAFAKECSEGMGCKIYKKRPINCRIFPINKRDLSDRDILMPGQRCGYHFDENSRKNGHKRRKV